MVSGHPGGTSPLQARHWSQLTGSHLTVQRAVRTPRATTMAGVEEACGSHLPFLSSDSAEYEGLCPSRAPMLRLCAAAAFLWGPQT